MPQRGLSNQEEESPIIKIHPMMSSSRLVSLLSAAMDSGTLGLASALAELGIYELADLVEMARAGDLHEMIVVAVDQGQI